MTFDTTPCMPSPTQQHCDHLNAQNMPGFTSNNEFFTCCWCGRPFSFVHGVFKPWIPPVK